MSETSPQPEPTQPPAEGTPALPAPAEQTRARRNRALIPLTVAVTAGLVAVAIALTPGNRSSGTGSPGAGAGTPGATVTPTGQASGTATGSPGALPEPRPELLALARKDPQDPLAVGRIDAPVTMIQYSDFACGYCRKYALETEPALIDKFVKTGVLRIEWHDFPYLSEGSRQAALAGRAAGASGKFWELHHAIFTDDTDTDQRLGLSNLASLAESIGLDPREFAAAMTDKSAVAQVKKDFEAAQAVGVNATPSFVINGRSFVGAQPLESFIGLIELSAAEAR